jgi:hypothetical protein
MAVRLLWKTVCYGRKFGFSLNSSLFILYVVGLGVVDLGAVDLGAVDLGAMDISVIDLNKI